MSGGGKAHLEVTAAQPRHPVTAAAEVVRLRPLSPTVLALTLRVPDAQFSFHAGQWVDFAIAGTSLVGGYSMCSSPLQLRQSETLELAVKRSTWPPAQWVHTQCREGSRVTLTAGGSFYYDPAPARVRPLLLVAGGVGINPLLSILRHCADLRRCGAADGAAGGAASTPAAQLPSRAVAPGSRLCRAVRRETDDTAAAGVAAADDGCRGAAAPPRHLLLYSASSQNELLFREQLNALEQEGVVTARYFVTREQEPASEEPDKRLNYRRLGYSDLCWALDALRQCGADDVGDGGHSDGSRSAPSPLCFLCGPSAMVEQLHGWLQRLYVPRDHVRYERWW